jgi:glutathione S-transferase
MLCSPKMAEEVRRLLLFDSRVSGNCYKVRLLLAQLGRTYERHEVDVVNRAGRLELLGELNPGLRVPTLVFDDGRALGESNAIIWYLAQDSEYLPDDAFARAQVLQWMFFEQYSHEPNIAVARFLLAISDRPPDPERVAALQRAGYAALDALERELATRDFLVGECYSIADIALYAYTHVAEEGGFELARYPAIGAWLARVAGQPRHVPISA